VTDFILALLWVPPLAAAVLAILVVRYRPFVGRTSVVLSTVSFAASVWLCDQVLTGALAPPTGDVWRIDALSALLAVCITLVSLLASAFGPGLGVDEAEDVGSTRRFRIFQNVFALTMLMAVTANNVALMWVAIEATTIASAITIPLVRTKASVEASWKYLLICSVGIALAFTGTVLAYFDFVSTAGRLPGALHWGVLYDAAPALHPELMQLAFVFILIGYGTKAGLAPMHTWMPDAYAEAPSPIAAMMSGALVAVSMYAIARWKSVVDAAVSPAFANTLLIGVGLLSVAVGAFSLVVQRHYKRMLAYSSIEHMGLISVGLALGPPGVFAALLHLINHAVAKSMSFLLAGRILRRYGTTEVAGVSGLLKAMPWTGPLFAAGIFTLVGLPPFGLFVSEYLLVQAAVVAGRLWVAGAVLLLLLTAFIALLNHLSRMLYGAVPDGVVVGERRGWALMALGGCAMVLIALGLVLPRPVIALLHQSVTSLMP
jgi:hydrogenase-4 component F